MEAYNTIFKLSIKVVMGLYPNFNSFIFNEDVKEVQNLHNKQWEFKKKSNINNNNDSIFVGVSW